MASEPLQPVQKRSQPIPHQLLMVLMTLYFAQGLPSGFITQALPAILRTYEVSLEMIGWSGLLLAPWALKFLWAPVVDAYFSPRLGRARSWILPLQVLSAAIVIAVAGFDPNNLTDPAMLWSLYLLLLLLSIVGATHDVATDALATRTLALPTALSDLNNSLNKPAQNPNRGLGNAVQVIGYRLGLILGGGVFLMVIGRWSWQVSFFAMAALILINILPILRYREPIVAAPQSVLRRSDTLIRQRTLSVTRLIGYLQRQYGYFWQDRQMRAWLGVLLTFKMVDGISSGMVKPMMVDMGIATASIGLWVSVLGSVSSLLGAAVAAWLLKRIAHHQALVWFNALQVAATALYALVALSFEFGWFIKSHQTPPFWWAFAANAIEHLVAAMALVAMLTMVMHYARYDKAGSDFTTQVCLLTIFSGSTHLISGYLAAWLGYSGHFILSCLVGVLCLLPLLYWRAVFKRASSRHSH